MDYSILNPSFGSETKFSHMKQHTSPHKAAGKIIFCILFLHTFYKTGRQYIRKWMIICYVFCSKFLLKSLIVVLTNYECAPCSYLLGPPEIKSCSPLVPRLHFMSQVHNGVYHVQGNCCRPPSCFQPHRHSVQRTKLNNCIFNMNNNFEYRAAAVVSEKYGVFG
jgi:hypothetical protein